MWMRALAITVLHTGAFLDEVSARAAAQNEQYLELMETPTWNRLNTITKDRAWREDLAGLRGELFARGPAAKPPPPPGLRRQT
jgi:adenosine deaminase